MSHYAVAVFHREDQDIEDLLAPYDEGLDVDPYIEFTREEAIAYGRENLRSEALEGKTEQEIWQEIANWYDNRTDEDGNIYSTYNPNSKWDWYCEGGRFSGLLTLKDGESCDSARIADIDFSDDEEAYRNALRFWDVVVGGAEPKEGEDCFSLYNPQYYLDYFGDRETFARSRARWTTFAVLDPNGEWHAPGRMGWFGVSHETPEDSRDWYAHYRERFIDTADPDWILTIVDCHI